MHAKKHDKITQGSNLVGIKKLNPTLKLSPAEDVIHDDDQPKKRHGREYSLQLQVTDRPVNHVSLTDETEQQQRDSIELAEADLQAVPKRLSRSQPPPHDPAFLSPCKLLSHI